MKIISKYKWTRYENFTDFQALIIINIHSDFNIDLMKNLHFYVLLNLKKSNILIDISK